MDKSVKEEVLDVHQVVSNEFCDYDIVKEENTIEDVNYTDQRDTGTNKDLNFVITEIDANLKTKEKQHECQICGKEWKNKSYLKKHLISHSSEKNFECPECSKTFKRNSSLVAHMKTHNENLAVQCHICNKFMSTCHVLKKHIRLQHDTMKIRYECSSCGKIFTTKAAMANHMKRFHDGEDRKPLICHECGKTYEARHLISYERHVASHKKLYCNICLRKFASRRCLKKHMSTHSAEKPFACETCNRTFRLKEYLMSHRLTHLKVSEPRVNCIYCSKVFNKKGGLQSHMKTHHRGLPKAEGATPSCTICKTVCENMEDLMKHVETHRVENRIECAICGLKTKFKYLMAHHIQRIHLKMNILRGKEVECPTCSKKCTTRSLNAHMICHTTERPFTCDVCDMTFKRKEILKQHKLSHVHATKSQYRECSYCTKTYWSRHSQAEHMRSQHRGLPVYPKGPPFKCTVCRLSLKELDDLKKHVVIHRRVFKCAICEKKFVDKRFLKIHIDKIHQRPKK